jgi:regulator of RNase E activity RraB
MIVRKWKFAFCLIVVSLVSEISAEFVLGSISDKLSIQIQDIQQLIVQEQRAEEAKKLEQVSPSMTTTETSDGHKSVVVEFIEDSQAEASLSGEIIKTHLQRIVDLIVAKNVYDLWTSYFRTLLETELAFIMIFSGVLRSQYGRTWNVFLASTKP